jgi:hypothetical protein
MIPFGRVIISDPKRILNLSKKNQDHFLVAGWALQLSPVCSSIILATDAPASARI